MPRHAARATVQRTLSLLRVIFNDAVQNGHIAVNPAVAVKARRREHVTEEPWDYLRAGEIEAFRASAVPDAAKALVLFAVGTGLRQGEQWNLEIRDVHVDGDRHAPPWRAERP